MTFHEVEALLPNGFHDAFLRGVAVDYARRRAVFDLEVWVGDLDLTDQSEREAYRRAELTLTGLLLCTLDAPNGEFLGDLPNGLGIDIAPLDYSGKDTRPEGTLPEGAFRRSFYFTDDANTFVHFAATGAEWEWRSEARVIY